jgi:hypothetical protein
MLVAMHREEAETALRAVEDRLAEGRRPTEAQVSQLHQAVDGLRLVTEDYVAEYAEPGPE